MAEDQTNRLRTKKTNGCKHYMYNNNFNYNNLVIIHNLRYHWKPPSVNFSSDFIPNPCH